ncbi:hypothetical protein [Dictyobacter aurantiacus]|uniref:Peptidase A2 domain-containing protein n=1 Tax=Dictyobacter aurantiacus TaxID=1936993 RepID=A0A401ZR76_9CHLR|nr:hypothetical protein [Dictyobacter aurantiacus]GCE09373.1 hypothetical protein KDAU_67020 [Dictyobacter aurantiacus]
MGKTAVTVPLYIMKNRPFIDVSFRTDDCQPRKARCWLDTGGGAVIITEHLAQELGVVYKRHDVELVPARLPALSIDEIQLDLTRVPTFVALGQQTIQGEEGIEVFCGAPLLSKFYLIFDYPQQQFTLISPDHAPRSAGVCLPVGIQATSHFPRVEVQIGRDIYGMLLDTGASKTMVSQTVIDAWVSQNPSVLKVEASSTFLDEMQEIKDEQTAYISHLTWGPYHIDDLSIVSRPAGVFEQALSQMTSEPVIGALAGDVLSQFRCEIDYAASFLYLHRSRGAN